MHSGDIETNDQRQKFKLVDIIYTLSSLSSHGELELDVHLPWWMACEVRVHGSCFWLLELTDGKTVTPDDMFRGMCFPTEVEEPYSLSHGYLRMVLFTVTAYLSWF